MHLPGDFNRVGINIDDDRVSRASGYYGKVLLSTSPFLIVPKGWGGVGGGRARVPKNWGLGAAVGLCAGLWKVLMS